MAHASKYMRDADARRGKSHRKAERQWSLEVRHWWWWCLEGKGKDGKLRVLVWSPVCFLGKTAGC